MVENETWLKVKCLRSDNGGEYVDKSFKEFYAVTGIRMEKTIPKTPQQNGSDARNKLNPKSKKYTFIGYGTDEFGDQNRKIIRSRDVVFNEKVMYKDKLALDSTNEGAHTENDELVELEEISEENVQRRRFLASLHYLLLSDGGEPESYDEAVQVGDSTKWESAMQDEMDPLMSNQTWELTELPRARRFYITSGFTESRKNMMATSAPRKWYKKFDGFTCSNGFTRYYADHCCYVKRFDNSYIILLLYVDDMLVAGLSLEEIKNLKKQLSMHFAMKDLGEAKQILGMRICRDRMGDTLKLSQTQYVKKVLSKFSMQDAKPVNTPLVSHFITAMMPEWRDATSVLREATSDRRETTTSSKVCICLPRLGVYAGASGMTGSGE
ncbi:uncharacterized protein LOC132270066 [Cornus florida]|uniref:uncharacterized protein LOC132270066 n=1 Tax=Cornus florida TaxID=4283 RepID=UPI002898FDAD|nr:uncharacterized protein LOC132270066 [Cornus florida]